MGGTLLNGDSGAPWFVEQAKRHGVAFIFACFLLLAAFGIIPSSISHTEEMIQSHTLRDQEELVLLLLICQHTAKDREEQNACVQAPVTASMVAKAGGR